MTIKELDRKIDDSVLQVLKYLFLDVVISFCILKINEFHAFFVLVPLLLCTVIATYDWIDRIDYIKKKKKELMIELEELSQKNEKDA